MTSRSRLSKPGFTYTGITPFRRTTEESPSGRPSSVRHACLRATSNDRKREYEYMCLGVPGLVVAVDGNVATVDFWGVQKTVLLDIVDAPVAPGDYILNHVGFAIRRIPADEARATLD